LIIEEPWRSVTDPLLATTELTPLVLAPALIVALVAIWFGVRQIMQPLQTLEQKASALGWGNFEPIKEPVGGISEIRRLQTELIHMAQKVQAAQQSMRGYLSAITMGQEEERRRLARDIHDDTIQSLIALNQQVQMAQMLVNDQPTDRLVEMQQMITQIIADLRRFSQDLRPIYLEDLGLIPALDMLARDVDAETHITFHTQGTEKRLPGAVELALYRIVQEALSNIARHAGATNAHVQLDFAPEAVTLTVSDDGCGFNVPDSPAEMAPAGHFGLLGVKERAELIGARLVIESAPGVGTSMTITLPHDIRTTQWQVTAQSQP
jgi:two-component system sensor histidine kinase UhpB